MRVSTRGVLTLGVATALLVFIHCTQNHKLNIRTVARDAITNDTLLSYILDEEPTSLNASKGLNETLTKSMTTTPTEEYNASSSSKDYRKITYDETRPSHYLWPNDPSCSKYKVSFGKNLTGTFLLTFPRSGNTWTRYLLEAATGVFTGSIYNSKFLLDLGYLGEADPPLSPGTIVTKTHWLTPVVNSSETPIIMIIRNPARAIVSYWNYANVPNENKKFVNSIDKAYYNTPEFRKFTADKLYKWRRLCHYALTRAPRVHIVFYEELRDHPLRELHGMLKFLRVKPDMNRLFCLSRHLEGKAKGAQRHEDPFPKDLRKKLNSAIIEANKLLRGRGFRPLPDYRKYDS